MGTFSTREECQPGAKWNENIECKRQNDACSGWKNTRSGEGTMLASDKVLLCALKDIRATEVLEMRFGELCS